jgi:predicted GNAT family acetyltransferase
VDKTLTYYLMTRSRDIPLPDLPVPPGLHVETLTPRNSKRVFPLEEQYQHEEVLVHPERYNRQAHMLHFKKTATLQHVVFAENSTGPVAKAGTNSIGIGYCQIGGVYTLPPYRRQGISRALMVRVLGWARHAGFSAALFVQKNNRAAVELYRSLSFDVETDYRIIYMQLD